MKEFVEKLKKTIGVKVVPVNAPGFVGPKNLGNRIAGEVLGEHVVGTEEPPFIQENAVNIIGKYNIAGDLWLIEPLLAEAGINILSRITGNSTFREISWAYRAKLNVIVCSRALVNIGKEMERQYGIPFKDYKEIHGKRAVLYSGGVKSWAMISALKDLGLEVVAVGIKRSTYEDEKKIKELVNDNCVLFEDTSLANILKIMKEQKADILIAGGRNQHLVIKYGFPFVDVNQERHIAYAGYRGLINLAKKINKTLTFYSAKESISYSSEHSVIRKDNV